MEDELRGQLREITGDPVVVCEICQRAVTRYHVVPVDGTAAASEPVEEIRVCEDCYAQIERGEIKIPGNDDSVVDDIP